MMPMAYSSPSRVEMICHCGEHYKARTADINRGWGLACSKSCAARRKTHGFKAAIYATGKQVPNRLKSNKPKKRNYPKPRTNISDYERQEIEHQECLEASSSCHGQDIGDY